jgi:hypothetical protein
MSRTAALAIVVGAAASGEAALFLVLSHNNWFCVLHDLPFALKVRVTFALKSVKPTPFLCRWAV